MADILKMAQILKDAGIHAYSLPTARTAQEWDEYRRKIAIYLAEHGCYMGAIVKLKRYIPEQLFDTFDHFEQKPTDAKLEELSNQDSFYNLFTCRHCGISKELYFPGDAFFTDQARITLRDHLSLCTEFNKA